MPRCTIKHTINDIDYYMHFSGICDEPLTDFMTLDNFKEYYINEYSEEDWKSFLMGNRNMNDIDWAVLSYNLNKQESEQLTKEQFIEKFTKDNHANYNKKLDDNIDNTIIFDHGNKPCDCYNDYFCKDGGWITLEFSLEIKSIYYYPKINFCPICGKKIVIDEV